MSCYSAAVAQLPAGAFMLPDFGLAESSAAGLAPSRRGYWLLRRLPRRHAVGIELIGDGKEQTAHAARCDDSYRTLPCSWIAGSLWAPARLCRRPARAMTASSL